MLVLRPRGRTGVAPDEDVPRSRYGAAEGVSVQILKV